MRLSAKALKNVANVNHWEYASNIFVQEGQSNTFYIQLVDLDQTPVEGDSEFLPQHPMRHIPQGTVVELDVTFPALRSELDDDGAEQFTVAASQPFPSDGSIWRVDLSNTQTPKSGNITLALTVDGNVFNFKMLQAIQTSLLEIGSC